MMMLLCSFVTNGQARLQAGHPVTLHELQGDKNQMAGCNRPEKPKLHKTHENNAGVAVACLYYGDQEVIYSKTLSAASDYRHC